MIDAADLAILETLADAMNPVERRLVEEVRRRKDALDGHEGLEAKIAELEEELDEVTIELDDAKEENERLERELAICETHARESDRAKTEAENKLRELKTEIGQLVGIHAKVEDDAAA